METMGTIALKRSETSRTRLKDLWDLTKPRMNMVVVVTTLGGYYLAAPGPVEWIRLIPTLVGTALAAAGGAQAVDGAAGRVKLRARGPAEPVAARDAARG